MCSDLFRAVQVAVIAAGLTVLIAVTSASAAPAAAPGGPRGGACGVTRWGIQTLADRPLLLRNQLTTLHHLTTRPVPSSLPPARRLAFERHVFTVVAAVTRVRAEPESDLNLVLREGGYHMVGEAPAPECDHGAAPGLRRKMASARGAVRLCKRARITGVAFFEQKAREAGEARNAIELHPILGFRCLTP